MHPSELLRQTGSRWKASSGGHFERHDDFELSCVIAIHRRADELHALPTYRECVEVIQSNENWRGQFGTLVGTVYSSTRLDIDGFLGSCLGDAMSASLNGRDGRAAAAERVASLERFLHSRELPVEVISPLIGFASDVGLIEIDSGLSIVPVDEAQVAPR